ncbi:MAG: 30S ribosomal protein S19 [Candidatus Woesearchaeota archaeon]
MVKKEFKYYGKSEAEVMKMSIKEFADISPSRVRRVLNRGFTEYQKALLEKVRGGKRTIRTHCRDMIIIPELIGKTINVHSGKEFVPVIILPEMIGHYLGEFVMTRRKVAHNAPGIGATRSSASASVR